LIKKKIGIMGFGVVGSALYHYLALSPAVEFSLIDPRLDLVDPITECDAVFICVPVPTLSNRIQDLSALHHCLGTLRKSKAFLNRPIFIKSTILPGTADALASEYMLRIYHMPEFLTERTASEDMKTQDVICGGRSSMTFEHMTFVKDLFSNKKILFMSNKEAELCKYAHNAFAALKVNFFNLIFEASHKIGCNYQQVLEGARVSGFIEPTHTQVPGPDGKRGYGGKCLPKDLSAFIGFLEKYSLSTMT
jgi:nucleotide sugar dehydrogenase